MLPCCRTINPNYIWFLREAAHVHYSRRFDRQTFAGHFESFLRDFFGRGIGARQRFRAQFPKNKEEVGGSRYSSFFRFL
jgi:hypothetical protein